MKVCLHFNVGTHYKVWEQLSKLYLYSSQNNNLFIALDRRFICKHLSRHITRITFLTRKPRTCMTRGSALLSITAFSRKQRQNCCYCQPTPQLQKQQPSQNAVAARFKWMSCPPH